VTGDLWCLVICKALRQTLKEKGVRLPPWLRQAEGRRYNTQERCRKPALREGRAEGLEFEGDDLVEKAEQGGALISCAGLANFLVGGDAR
jgi:hypothetical protein